MRAHNIVASLREAISAGRYAPGQKLNEEVPAYILGHIKEYVASSAAVLNPEETLGGWGNHAHYWMIEKAA